jgi:hypothetical protein
MPVAAQVGRLGGHDDEMPRARPDVLEAAGAEVGLAGLKRVDEADLVRRVQRGIRAQSRIPAITAKATTTIT